MFSEEVEEDLSFLSEGKMARVPFTLALRKPWSKADVWSILRESKVEMLLTLWPFDSRGDKFCTTKGPSTSFPTSPFNLPPPLVCISWKLEPSPLPLKLNNLSPNFQWYPHLALYCPSCTPKPLHITYENLEKRSKNSQYRYDIIKLNGLLQN